MSTRENIRLIARAPLFLQLNGKNQLYQKSLQKDMRGLGPDVMSVV